MSALAHDIDHIRNVFLAQLVRARLDHDAQHRLGAALAQEDAALIAEALSHRLHRRNDGGVTERGVLIVDLHVRELLRIFAHGRSQLGERLFAVEHDLHELDSCKQAVAGIGVLAEK